MEPSGEASSAGPPTRSSSASRYLPREKRSWFGNPTPGSVRPCVSGSPKPLDLPLSPATTSGKPLRLCPWRALNSPSQT
uniref:Uncharacterized protein n=1 Tax=Vombatus ursinus TaxID=29139 RepID=A0A4X2JVP3_VOMUR